MRTYWMKIVVGALAIFALGMLGVFLVRRGADRVHHLVDSGDPITIPLAFVPFNVNGEKLGTIGALVLHRSGPKKVTGADLKVDLTQPSAAAGLAQCVLVAEHIDNIDLHSIFTCGAARDTSGRGLARVGVVSLGMGHASVPFFASKAQLDDFRHNARDVADSATNAASDSAASADGEPDSTGAQLRVGTPALPVSPTADSPGRAGKELGDSIRATVERVRKSQRARHATP